MLRARQATRGHLPRVELFPLRYRDRLTGKSVKARYVAERHEIAQRYTVWEIIGPPEIRDVDSDAQYSAPGDERC